MAKRLKKSLSGMRFTGEPWSAAREEENRNAGGDVGRIVRRAVMGRSFMDFASGALLRVVGIEWPAFSAEGHLTLINPKNGEKARRRCVYDALTHKIKMYPV
jgi:hypothetical protein